MAATRVVEYALSERSCKQSKGAVAGLDVLLTHSVESFLHPVALHSAKELVFELHAVRHALISQL